MPTTQTQNTTNTIPLDKGGVKGIWNTAGGISPTIRFPWFSDWREEKKLGEVANIYDGTHQTPNYVESGVKFVSVENIKNLNKTTKFITQEAFEKWFKIKPQKNDILMTRITAGIIGDTAIVQNNEPLWYYVSLALIRNKIDISIKFLNQRINTNLFKNELHKRIIHVAFPKKINLWDINDCWISLPSLPEQEKIASFLTTVDQKIEKIREKKGLLEEYKKGLMQRLFHPPLKGDTGGSEKDYLRFPGFSDEWEEKKLGEICEITTWKLDANAMVENWEYRFYTCAKEYFKIDNYAFDTEALLISGNGANVWYIHYYNGKFNAYQRTYVLDKFEEHIFYIKYYLEKFLKRRIWAEKNEWNTPYIVLGTLADMKIKLPSISEQEKIANFLSAIDEKIEAVDSELVEVENWKKGLLQGLFV